ncbi:MAG: TIGR04372 family glycosyltransferase [Nitrospirae bacterium YQR-1]
MFTKIKLTARHLLDVIAITAMFIFSLLRLLCNIKSIHNAELIVVMPEGGFGHTCILPDAMRRLFKGKKLLCICLSYYNRHNWKLPLIWKDIVQLFLPLQAGVSLFGHKFISTKSPFYRNTLILTVFKFAHIVNNHNAQIMLYEKFLASYLMPLVPEGFRKSSSEVSNAAQHQWIVAYYKIVQGTDVPKASLPHHIREQIAQRLDCVCRLKGKKLCGLYLRQKGRSMMDNVTNTARDGSALEEYLPAVEFLIKNGYQVLLTGDVLCPEPIYRRFKGMLADYKKLKCNEKYFNLFVCTEVDMFIGENGGAITLPAVNKTPILCLNAYPYAFTTASTFLWIYYKTLRDTSGDLIHYKDIFKDSPYLYDYHIQRNYTLHTIGGDDILKAVRYFVEDIKNTPALNIKDRPIENTLPDYVFLKHVNARLSPAFLELFEKDSV